MAEYRMDADYPGLAMDGGAQGVLVKPLDRIDGPAKATGAARYGSDHQVDGEIAHGVPITAPVAKGSVTGFNFFLR